MSPLKSLCRLILIIGILTFSNAILADGSQGIPILVYHNLNPTKPGYMNMTPARFETEMKWLKDNGFTFIPLKEAVAYLQGKRTALPPKPIVLTADDGWESVYTYMIPVVKKYQIPLTLFIYPGTISSGKHAMTWEQLKTLQQDALIDIQGHTYSHPNFKQMKKHLSPDAYEKFINHELAYSRQELNDKLHINVTLLAWPFGIYNDQLEQAAANAGYEMAFTIDDKPAYRRYRPMAQPRFMILESESMNTFMSIANRANH